MSGRYLRVMLPVLLLMGACGTGAGGRSSGGEAATLYWFRTLPRMVATTDVTFLGTVVDVRDGTTVGPPGEEIEHLDVSIRVDEAFFGPPISENTTLIVQTLKFVAPEREWREVGNTVLAFLNLSPDPVDNGRYYVETDQCVYLVEGTDILTAVEGDPLSEEVAAMSIGQFRSEMVQVTPAVEAGEVKPQRPAGG